MKLRLFACLALAIGLTLGVTTPANATPKAVDHLPWSSFEYDVCTYTKNAAGYTGFYVDTDDSTWGHGYDGHHIVWCAARLIGSSSNANSICWYVDYNTGWRSGFRAAPNNGCWDTSGP